jgi:ribosome-binding protein aMBF1 (putative translation factor)
MLDVALTLKGWSKAQLSYQLHMDRSMVTHWIKGSRPISTEQRKRLWKILGKELMAAQKIRY